MTNQKNPHDTLHQARRILTGSYYTQDDECEEALREAFRILSAYLDAEYDKRKMRRNVTRNVLIVLFLFSFWSGLMLIGFGLEGVFTGELVRGLLLFSIAAIDLIACAIFYGIRQSM